MSTFPNRCQHLKVNGTQCGSPALRRNRYCFFHKRFQDERIHLHADRVRRAASFVLPVLEDANSIQVALMQVMRLLVSKQIEHKTASLLLYALQTASTNLRMTNFNPHHHDVILDPRDASDSLIDERLWTDEDFEEEEDEDEEDAEQVRQERRQQDEAETNRWVEELAKHYAEEGLRKNLREAVRQARLEHAQKAAKDRANREFEQREAQRQAREQAARVRPTATQTPTAPQTQTNKQEIPVTTTPSTVSNQKAPSKPEAPTGEHTPEKKPSTSVHSEEIRAQNSSQ